MASNLVNDAHRHIGLLPAFPFYGGPPVHPDTSARGTVKDLLADLDAEGTEQAMVMPNYGVPDAAVSFSFNELALEAAAADDRVSCGLWVSPRPQDAELNASALAHAGEKGVKVLKTSFLLGGRVDDPDVCPAAGPDLRRGTRPLDLSYTCTHRPAELQTLTRSVRSSSATGMTSRSTWYIWAAG